MNAFDADLLSGVLILAGLFATATLLSAIAILIQLALAYRAEMRIRHADESLASRQTPRWGKGRDGIA